MDKRSWYKVTVKHRLGGDESSPWECNIIALDTNRAMDQVVRGREEKYQVISVVRGGTKAEYDATLGDSPKSDMSLFVDCVLGFTKES